MPGEAWTSGFLPLEKAQRLPRNPKEHDIGMLHGLMEKHGYLEPITVNTRTGRLIGGHGRIDTLQQKKATGQPPPQGIRARNGSWEVPVWFVDVPEEREEAAAVALNRATEAGGWNEAELAEVLSDLAAQGELDGTGYDEEDLDRLIGDLAGGNKSFNQIENEEERAWLRPLACFMGAYFIHLSSQVDVEKLSQWSKTPLSFPEITDIMVSDFCTMWKKRETRVDFLTVPPPSGKRETGYDEYPIDIVAQKFSETTGLPYIRIFKPRQIKIRSGSRAKSHQKQEPFIMERPNGMNVGLVLDDVSTTRTTFSLVHKSFIDNEMTPFCVAWCSFR